MYQQGACGSSCANARAEGLQASRVGARTQACRRLLAAIDDRYVVSVNDKLLALCGWFFEYIYEPCTSRIRGFFMRRTFTGSLRCTLGSG